MLASQALRQIGHFFYERQDPDLEKMKYGHINSTKWATTFALLLTYIAYVMGFFGALSSDKLLPIALLLCFTPHFAEICHFYGFVRGCDWIVKIITDPITDLFDFYDCAFIHPTEFLQHKWLEEKEKSKAKSSSCQRVGLLQRIKKN